MNTEKHAPVSELSEQEALVKQWLQQSPLHWQALRDARGLNLPDWCLAAGFVRNLIWDRLHGYTEVTPLNDIDLIYFDAKQASEAYDRELEVRLRAASEHNWSVKNQARMHTRNGDRPYVSTEDAMSYWVEVETAIGVTLDEQDNPILVAPFGVSANFNSRITLNTKRPKPEIFRHRVQSKGWLTRWPRLSVAAE